MDKHYMRYSTGEQSAPSNTVTDGGDTYTIGSGYFCGGCGQWVYSHQVHNCPGYSCVPYCPTVWTYPSENKTEKAYAVLKKLVEMKIIPEPKTYKAFCDLIEGIRAAL